ncbi:MAG: hypothetical protein ABMA64_04815, partial [Myxococcota bacterium]
MSRSDVAVGKRRGAPAVDVSPAIVQAPILAEPSPSQLVRTTHDQLGNAAVATAVAGDPAGGLGTRTRRRLGVALDPPAQGPRPSVGAALLAPHADALGAGPFRPALATAAAAPAAAGPVAQGVSPDAVDPAHPAAVPALVAPADPAKVSVPDPKTGKTDGTNGKLADLERQKAQLENDIRWVDEDLWWTDHHLEREEREIGKDEDETRRSNRQIGDRRAEVQRIAAIARAAGKSGPNLEQDPALRRLDRRVQVLQGEIHQDQIDKVGLDAEGVVHRDRRLALEDELAKVEAALAQAKSGGGGGGGGAPPEVNVPATSKRLLGPVQALAPAAALAVKRAGPRAKATAEARESLESQLTTAKGQVPGAQGEVNTRAEAARTARADLQARKDALAAAQKADPSNKATEWTDPDCRKAHAAVAAADKDHKRAVTALDTLRGKIDKLEKVDLPKARKAADEAKKALADAEKHQLEVDTAVKDLSSKGGAPHWEVIASGLKLKVAPVHLPPGMMADPDGKPIPKPKEPADLPMSEEEKKAKAEADAKAAKEEAEKKAREAEEDRKLTPAQRLEKQQQAEKKKEADKADALLARVSDLQKLPTAERDAALAKLAKAEGKSPDQLKSMHQQQVDAASAAMKKANLDPNGPKPTADQLKAMGVSASQFEAARESERLKKLKADAAQALGGAGDEAYDQLCKHGKDRGLTPRDMLTHLSNVDPTKVPPELRELANKANAAEKKRLADLPQEQRPKPEDLKAKLDQANAKEQDLVDVKKIAAAMNCDPKEARARLDELEKATGAPRADAVAALTAGGAKGEKLPPAELQKQLREIHLLDPKDRAAALAKLAARVGDPARLTGALLTPDPNAEGKAVTGPVGNDALKARLDAINALPKDQQWEKLVALGDETGTSPKALWQANQNLAKKREVLGSVSAVKAGALTSDEKKEKLTALAKKYNTDVASLEADYAADLGGTGKAIDKALHPVRADGQPGAVSPAVRTAVDKLEKEGAKLTPEQRKRQIEVIAKQTGIPIDQLERKYAQDAWDKKAAQWQKQFGGADPAAAADQVVKKSRELDMTPDELVTFLRDTPKDALKSDPTLADMKGGLTLSDLTDPEQKGKGKAKKLPDPDEKPLADRKKELVDELSSSVYVSDDKMKKLVEKLDDAELAALLHADPPIKITSGKNKGKTLQEAMFAGVDSDSESGKFLNGRVSAAAAAKARVDNQAAADDKARANAKAVLSRAKAANDTAAALGIGVQEAHRQLAALAVAQGKTKEQVAADLGTDPAKAKEALKVEYAKKGPNGEPSELLAVRLRQIEDLPAEERMAAYEALSTRSGLDLEALSAARYRVRQQTKMFADIGRLQDLPKADQDKAWPELAKKYGKTAEELQKAYRDRMSDLAARLPKGALVVTPASSCATDDVQAQIDALVAQGVPRSDAQLVVASERRRVFEASHGAAMAKGPGGVDGFKKVADEKGMTPEAYADYLARTPESKLTPDDRLRRKALLDHGYQIARSKAELDAARAQGLIVDPNDPAYVQKKTAFLIELENAADDDLLMEHLNKMSPAERRQLRIDWEEKRQADLEAGKPDPGSLDDKMSGAVDFSEQDQWTALDKDDQKNLDGKDPLAQLDAVDTADGTPYAGKRDALMTTLAVGADKVDKAAVKEALGAMTPGERAQFLRDYAELHVTLDAESKTGDLDHDTNKLPPADLAALFADEPDVLLMLDHAKRLTQTGLAQKHLERVNQVESAHAAATQAAAALNVSVKAAATMIASMARDTGLSPANAWRFMNNEPLVDERDTRSAFTRRWAADIQARVNPGGPSYGAPTPGELGLDQNKVADRVAKFSDLSDLEPDAVVKLVNGVNARELAEIERQLSAKGLDLTTLLQQKCPFDPRVGSALRKMAAFTADDRTNTLVRSIKDQDPRRDSDASTPEGFAARMAWARDLPPDQRLAELGRLQDDARKGGKVMGPRAVMAAYLNGPQGKGTAADPAMLGPAMRAQLDAIEKLPEWQRRSELDALLAVVGRTDAELTASRKRTDDGVELAKQLQQIEEMPAEERQAKLLELSEQTHRSLAELEEVRSAALAAGLVVVGNRPVPKDVALELDAIAALPPDQQQARIAALQARTGLQDADLVAHLNAQTEAAREARTRKEKDHATKDSLASALKKGDPKEVEKVLGPFRDKPDELQRVLALYEADGHDLDSELKKALGDGDAYHDLKDVCDVAKKLPPAVELPAGVTRAVPDELNRLRRLHLSDDAFRAKCDELRATHGLSEGDFATVQAFADRDQVVFDLKVNQKLAAFDREVDSNYVDDARIAALMASLTPEMVAEMLRRRPTLMDQIRAGLDQDSDVQRDFDFLVTASKAVASADPEKAKAALTEARLGHKQRELERQFDRDTASDPLRLKQLLADCSPEELKALDERFGGKLSEKLEQTQKKPDPWKYAQAALLTATLGPIGAVIGAGMVSGAAIDPAIYEMTARVRDATVDPAKGWPLDGARVDAVLGSLDADSWLTTDAALLGQLKSLNPRELVEAKSRWEGAHPGQRFDDLLKQRLDGDELALAVGSLRNAEDVVAGRDRNAEMLESCRTLVTQERFEELRRDPQNKGKTDAELWGRVDQEADKLDAKAKERVTKLKDAANTVFAAIDGWGDDVAKMNKALFALSPEEAALVQIEYRRHFGKDMLTHLEQDLGVVNAREFETVKMMMDPAQRTEGLRRYITSMSGSSTLEIALTGRPAEASERTEWLEGGFTEDEQGIYDAFEALSPEDRTRLVTAPGGKEFLDRVKKYLGTEEQAVVDAYCELDPVTGQALANPAHVAAAKMRIHLKGTGDWDVWSGAGTKEEELVAELDKLTPEQVQEAAKWYRERYGADFAADAADELGTDTREWQIVSAELRGDKVSADVHRIRWSAQDENLAFKAGMVALMVAAGPIGWAVLAAGVVAGVTGVTKDCLPWLPESTDEELLEKTLKAGKDGRGGRNPEHLKKVIAQFDATFGQQGGEYEVTDGSGGTAMDKFLDQETQGLERVYFGELAEKGEVDPAVELLYAMDGFGTDEQKVKATLESIRKMSPADRAAFKARFESMSREWVPNDVEGAVLDGAIMGGATSLYSFQRKGHSLEDWLEAELGGTELLEAQIALMGEPKTPEEFLAIAKLRYQFERGDPINGFMNGFMDGLEVAGVHSNGSLFAQNLGEMMAMFDRDGKFVGDRAKLEELAGWVGQDGGRYRETRDAVTDAVVNTIQMVGAAVLMVLPGGQGASVAMMIAMFAATTMAKVAMKGNGFGVEEFGMDLANLGVQLATAGLGPSFQKIGERLGGMLKAAMKLGEGAVKFVTGLVREMVKGGVEGLLTGILSSEGELAKGDFAVLKHLLVSTFGGAAKSGVLFAGGQLLEHSPLGKALERVEDGNPLGNSSAAGHFGLNYAKQVLEAGMGVAVDWKNWEGWANGKGITLAQLRMVFVESAVKAFAKTAVSRDPVAVRARLDQARAGVAAAEQKAAHLAAELETELPPAKRAAVERELGELHQAIAQHRTTLARITEDDAKLAAREQEVRERAEAEQRAAAADLKRKAAPTADEPPSERARSAGVREAADQVGKQANLGGDESSFAELNDGPVAPTQKPVDPGETWTMPKGPHDDPELAAHQSDVDQRAARIREQNPGMSERDAVRMARNEALYAIGDADPAPRPSDAVVRAAEAGDAAAVLAHLHDVENPSVRRQLDLELRRSGTSLAEVIAGLPEHAQHAANAHLEGLRPSATQVDHAHHLLGEVERLRAAMLDGDTHAVAAYDRARQDVVEHLIDAYGIDDTSVRARDRGARTGLQAEASAIVAVSFLARGDAVAHPAGVVAVFETLFGAKGDAFSARSPGLIAAAIAHEAEIHANQLVQGRMGAMRTDAEIAARAPDTGTAVNEVEAYAFMARNADRFGLSDADLAPVTTGLDVHLRMLRAQSTVDPIPADGPLPPGVDPVVAAALRRLMAAEPRLATAGGGDGVYDPHTAGHATSDADALARVVAGDFSLTTPAEPAPGHGGWVGQAAQRSLDAPVMGQVAADLGAGKQVDLDLPHPVLVARALEQAHAALLEAQSADPRDRKAEAVANARLVALSEEAGFLPGKIEGRLEQQALAEVSAAEKKLAQAKRELERPAYPDQPSPARVAAAEQVLAEARAVYDAQVALRMARAEAVLSVGVPMPVMDAASLAYRAEVAAHDQFSKGRRVADGLHELRAELAGTHRFVNENGNLEGWAGSQPLDRVAKSVGQEQLALLPADHPLRERSGDPIHQVAVSKALGEAAGDALAALQGWTPADDLHPTVTRDGARAFDRVFVDRDGNYVVVECKGGEAQLGSRGSSDGSLHVQQGSRAYLEAVIDDIAKRDPASAQRLADALEAGKVRAVSVRQPTQGPAVVDTYDVSAHYDLRGQRVLDPGTSRATSTAYAPPPVEDVWGRASAPAAARIAAHAQDLGLAVDALLGGAAAPGGVTRSERGVVIDVDGAPVHAEVRSATREEHAQLLAAGVVARYAPTADGGVEIVVVPGLHPVQAERAVAHEIVEVRDAARRTAPVDGSVDGSVDRSDPVDLTVSALAARPTGELSSDDAGRVAELLVLHDARDRHPQLVETELRSLVRDLGLDDPTPGTVDVTRGEQRLASIERHLAREQAAGRIDPRAADGLVDHLRALVAATPPTPVDGETGLSTPVGPAAIAHDGRYWHLDGIGADGLATLRPTRSVQVAIAKDQLSLVTGVPKDGAEVTFDGHPYRVTSTSDDGVVLTPIDPGPRPRVPLAELGPVQAFVAGQDGVWTVERKGDQLVAVERDSGRRLAVAPEQVEPTFRKANIDPRFTDSGDDHGMGEMDVHGSVVRRAREQSGLALVGDGLLDPRRGLGAAEVASVEVLSSPAVLGRLADALEASDGPLDLHYKRLQTVLSAKGDPEAAANAYRVIDAVLKRAEAGHPVTVYFGNERLNALADELAPELRERLTEARRTGALTLVGHPELSNPFNHVKSSVLGGEDPALIVATGEVGTGKRIDASLTVKGPAVPLYAEYVQRLAAGDTSPRRAELVDQLAQHGVALNDPIVGRYYAAQAHVGLISDASVAVSVRVKELDDPAVAERIVERARAGVQMDLMFRSMDDASRAVLERAIHEEQLPITLRKLDVPWHGNATFGYDGDGKLVAYVGTNYLWSNQSTNQASTSSYENGVVLAGDAAWDLYHQVNRATGGGHPPAIGDHLDRAAPAVPADDVDALAHAFGLKNGLPPATARAVEGV